MKSKDALVLIKDIRFEIGELLSDESKVPYRVTVSGVEVSAVCYLPDGSKFSGEVALTPDEVEEVKAFAEKVGRRVRGQF